MPDLAFAPNVCLPGSRGISTAKAPSQQCLLAAWSRATSAKIKRYQEGMPGMHCDVGVSYYLHVLNISKRWQYAIILIPLGSQNNEMIRDETVQPIKVGPVQGCQDREDKRPNVGGPLLLISGGATSVNA